MKIAPQCGVLPHELIRSLRAEGNKVHRGEREEPGMAPELLEVGSVPKEIGDSPASACGRRRCMRSEGAERSKDESWEDAKGRRRRERGGFDKKKCAWETCMWETGLGAEKAP